MASVKKDADGQVVVVAKVLGVERSKAGLKKDDTVTIKYAIPTKPVIGPKPVPLLVQDDVYPAFLNKKGDAFEPAAYGSSFEMTPEAVDGKAEKLGNAVQTVDKLLSVKLDDPKADELKKAVVAIGQGGDGMYMWVRGRLGTEQLSLEAEKDGKRAYLKADEVKEIDARIKFLGRVMYEIDAPR
ncbi:hypothetical protein FRUB_04229 [Fimbriiglobus ruber]|uniref:Uncharacterized protein n=1 Tax=Fimbriiglobus ruber TaxID=1908690 RepID=A0A225DL33_9BACT|nr:hypothetical protein FRUB_04229 [Fimbriiglobus ruber]